MPLLTHHDYTEYRAGDDWLIQATLTNPDGTPYDLTGATLSWILLGPDGLGAIATGYVVTIDADPTTGLATIAVDNSLTAPLEPGYYMDALRADKTDTTDPSGSVVTTMWDGSVGVCINMFYPLLPTPTDATDIPDVSDVPPTSAYRHVVYPDALTSMVLGPALPPSAGPFGLSRPTPVPQEMVPERIGTEVLPGDAPGPVGGGMVGYDPPED